MIGKALIITHSEDYTVDLVVSELNKLSLPFFRFNTDIDSVNLTFRFSSNQVQLPAAVSEYSSIWYRRLRNPQIQFEDIDQEAYYFQEYKDYLHNIISLLNGKWLSEPWWIQRAENKFLQLQTAVSVGLRIPDTIVSANLSEISEFSLRHKRTIIKPIYNNSYSSAGREYPIYTAELNPSKLDELTKNNLQFSNLPAIIQERIEKSIEYRVIIVDQNIFSCAVDPRIDGKEVVDWRKHKLSFFPKDIPEALREKLLLLMQKLNIKFGAFDLIEDRLGNIYFLEVNPNGQWGWLEMESGMKITDAIIRYLYD